VGLFTVEAIKTTLLGLVNEFEIVNVPGGSIKTKLSVNSFDCDLFQYPTKLVCYDELSVFE
jgi:hypothetical protein